ncbi:MAG TPA: SHOCT domain-containing protein, partial [Telluria sp.]|nr:SHOCT domain-containing protein [Telluria sp.]
MQSAIDKIRELRSLHEDGLLTRQEFDQRKHALLDALFAGAGRAQQARTTEIGLMAGQEIGPPQRRYRLDELLAQGSAT